MPRGRAGLAIIPPEEVIGAIRSRCLSDAAVAARFAVTDRTVRRWKRTGLPLYYGARNVTRDQWERFKATGQVSELTPAGRPKPVRPYDRSLARMRDRWGAGQVSPDPARPVREVDTADKSRPIVPTRRKRTPVDRHLSGSSRRAC